MKKNNRAWIYCRVAQKDIEALENQKQRLIFCAEKNGYQVVGLSCDTASGNTMERPGWKEIIEAVNAKKIDMVLAVNGSRVARNAMELLNCADWLGENNVKLITETDGVIGRLHVAVYMRLARMES